MQSLWLLGKALKDLYFIYICFHFFFFQLAMAYFKLFEEKILLVVKQIPSGIQDHLVPPSLPQLCFIRF